MGFTETMRLAPAALTLADISSTGSKLPKKLGCCISTLPTSWTASHPSVSGGNAVSMGTMETSILLAE